MAKKLDFITINIPQQLYNTMEDNTRYFDWSKDVPKFINNKIAKLQSQNIIRTQYYPKALNEKTVKVKIPIEREMTIQIKKYQKKVNWRYEIIDYLLAKENQIRQLKRQNHGLDSPDDIKIPKIQIRNDGSLLGKLVSDMDKFQQFIKDGTEITGVPFLWRQEENKETDKERKRILKDLPEQHLSHFEKNEMKDFFRKHNFYVTKFPTTPENDYPVACKILYCYFKYVGAKKNGIKEAKTFQKELQKRTKLETYKALMNEMDWNLERLFNSDTIRYIFTLPENRRIDVEIFDAKTMEQIAELDEKTWTIKELYPFLDRNEYVVHVYDLYLFNTMRLIREEIDLIDLCILFSPPLTIEELTNSLQIIKTPIYNPEEIFNGYQLDFMIFGNIPLLNKLILKFNKKWIQSTSTNVGFLYYNIKYNDGRIIKGLIYGINGITNFTNRLTNKANNSVELDKKFEPHLKEVLEARLIPEKDPNLIFTQNHTERSLFISLMYIIYQNRYEYAEYTEDFLEKFFSNPDNNDVQIYFPDSIIDSIQISLYTEKYYCTSCEAIIKDFIEWTDLKNKINMKVWSLFDEPLNTDEDPTVVNNPNNLVWQAQLRNMRRTMFEERINLFQLIYQYPEQN